jgi:hypothetical protein
MSVIPAIIARLKPADGAAFAIVAGAAEFAAIDTVPIATPAAYVFTLREASGENARQTGPVLQRIVSDIAVVIITKNVADVAGGAVSADIETLKEWVRSRLVGFVPEGAEEPVEHIAGEILKTKNGTVWWEETFGTASLIEEQS